ncbi:alpha/beta fold hydrolase [Paenibacillus thermotolerans]|uniref:alpha/beta fold hydrolase n=1 Tax=Paenibacillus thermotolerans TaxID=3027807 RepID=UPI0023688FF1|nr:MULTISPECIES: alpha/beta hydrolase [unclassified Paenibacillus]
MEQRRIQTNGTELYVELYGSPNAQETLFLLHPGGFNLFVWHNIIPLLERQFRIVAVDLRGHGQSALAEYGYEMTNQANDLIGVMDALGIDSAHMIGNSLGTDVAVHLAAIRPERVRTLVNIDAGMLNFIGPNGEVEGTKEQLVAGRLQRAIVEFRDRDAFGEYIRANYSGLGEQYVRRTSESAPLRLLSNGNVTHQMPNEIGARLTAAWCDMKFEDCYPSIQCPVLFLPAEQEAKLKEKLASIELHRLHLPHAEVDVIPGTTHIPLVTHAQELSDRISLFIRQHTA